LVKNRTYRVARGAGVLVVHFVTDDDVRWAELFGGETGDEVDKFARCDWRPGPDEVPVVAELENWFASRVLERLDFGGHHGFLLEPIESEAGGGEPPFTFHARPADRARARAVRRWLARLRLTTSPAAAASLAITTTAAPSIAYQCSGNRCVTRANHDGTRLGNAPRSGVYTESKSRRFTAWNCSENRCITGKVNLAKVDQIFRHLLRV
jgi:hypothetical protein